jgi:hypothetical protein
MTEVYPPSSECLERRKETASHRVGAAGMVAAAHSTSDQDSSRNRGPLSQSCRNRRAAAGRVGTYARKTGHRGDHRLWRGVRRSNGTVPTARPQSRFQRQRALPRSDRAGVVARPERDGDLAGSGGWSRFHRRLSERQALRKQAPRIAATGSSRGDRDGARRRSASRLWFGPDGARPADGQVPAHAVVRADAGPQPKIGSSAGVPLQLTRLGRAPRESVSPIGRRDTRGGAR